MRYFITIILLFTCIHLHPQVRAFPGAEGGGKYCTGGRGGRVLFVENLNNKGDGSFRDAIEAEGPRTIVFRVSGTIELEKTIHIKNGDLTIAGQTAPGAGICLKNYGVRVDADNVIIRYIRVRPGAQEDEENDAISGIRNNNVIIDHCSFSWANDEVASFYDNTNFTMQWCIVSESLYLSIHHKGTHGYGGIWGGYNASFHHNLLSDHTSRNPRLNGARYEGGLDQEIVDFRNNLIYNWGYNSIYGGEAGNYNLVNNYFKPGPATRDKVKDRILDLTQVFYNPSINKDTLYSGKFFIEGNFLEGNPGISENNWKKGVQGKGVDEQAKQRARLDAPVEHMEIPTSDACSACQDVLQFAGANKVWDAVDHRIINEVRTGRESYGTSYEGGNNGIIDSPADVGGWPDLASTPPPADSDRDGMPDSWEKKHDLDPLVRDDNAYTLDAQYTNIEVYINDLVKGLYPGINSERKSHIEKKCKL
ncbi:MAG: pectate lyase [Bacteroidales bacterium]|nr:pectate lyase [Bacteroidales bacterium]